MKSAHMKKFTFTEPYAKKYEKFKLFLQNRDDVDEFTRTRTRETLEKIENGILKQHLNDAGNLAKKEQRLRKRSSGYLIACFVLGGVIGGVLNFVPNMQEDVFNGLIGALLSGEFILSIAGIKSYIQSLLAPTSTKTKRELNKIQNEIAEFKESPAYLDAFMKINNLDQNYFEENQQVEAPPKHFLQSPLSNWDKLIEIYPELDN